MVVGPGLLTILVAGTASAFMAWSIGAGSSGSTPFAPAVGANAITTLRAAFLVGILGFAGAVLQGANVTEAVGRELVIGTTLSTPVTVAVLAGIVGAVVANIEFVLLGPPGESASVAGAVAASVDWPPTAMVAATTALLAGGIAGTLFRRASVDPTAANREFLLALGGLVAFSAGGTQVGLALGPLLPLLDPYELPL
ncbi:MAG: hypothetical protein ABEH56_00475 [Salinirussus sp.]